MMARRKRTLRPATRTPGLPDPSPRPRPEATPERLVEVRCPPDALDAILPTLREWAARPGFTVSIA